jgi:hypothetical protein
MLLMRLDLCIAALAISGSALGAQSPTAQRPPAHWAAGIELHGSHHPFPGTAVGVRLEHVVPVTGLFGFAIEGSYATLLSRGVTVACVFDDCDTRQVGSIASAAGLLVLGFPSGWRPSIRLGFGGYNAAWGYGDLYRLDPRTPDYAPDGPSGWLRQGSLMWNADVREIPLAFDLAYRWYENARAHRRARAELRAGVLVRFGGE